MFGGEDLLSFVRLADYVTVNDYEAQLLQDKTGKTLSELAQGLRALIVTRGGEGSTIYADGKEIIIPCAKAAAVLDPTGCGDAYRAGLLYGIQQGWDWEMTGRLASLMGTIKIASLGGQNHAPSIEDIKAQFLQNFGFAVPL
jgi:adenosine kinase